MARDETNPSGAGPRYTSLRDYLRVIRQHRLLVGLVTAAGVAAALAFSFAQDPTYEAEASLLFRPPTQDVELIGILSIRDQTPEQRAALGAEQANRREILDRVAKRLKIERDLEDDVEARAEVRTNLVVVQAQAGDPEEAERIAQAVAEEVARTERAEQRRRLEALIEAARAEQRRTLRGNDPVTRLQRQELERQLARLRATREFTAPVEIVEDAHADDSPVSPKPVRNGLIGFGVALVLGIGLAFLRAALDRKLRGADDLVAESGLPLLAVVRKDALGRVNAGDPRDPDAQADFEAFKILRMNLDYLDVDRPIRRVLVTSALAEEGKSTVAASLAVAAAAAGRDTLLVECDLRRPVLGERFRFAGEPGLTDYLGAQAEPQQVLRTASAGSPSANGSGPSAAEATQLAVIPAGKIVPRPTELLGSERFGRFVEEVSKAYDYVVFDSAPLLATADTLQLIEHVDAIVLCVRSDHTTRDQLRAALDALERLPSRPAGLVATGVSPRAAGDYGYYGFTYSRYSRSRVTA
jgi:capsular exopolysaccharide synthesis family protein